MERMSKVVAVVVTWRRERELERLLASLEQSTLPLHGCVVMDHAGTVPEEMSRRSFPVKVVQDTSNPGPGAGWANGTRHAWDIFGKTDVWYLDDDVVIPPDTLEILLREKRGSGGNGTQLGAVEDAAHSGQGSSFSKTQGGADACPGLLDAAPSGLNPKTAFSKHVPCSATSNAVFGLNPFGAVAICPLIEDREGRLWGFPEPVSKSDRKKIRAAATPADALRLLGPGRHPFCWATGACILVDGAAIETTGLHRGDFWMLGEDLEFSMRLAATGRAVFTCLAAVPHLPPEPADEAGARRADYRKFCALLQNLSYLSFHSLHSRHMWRYLPGNFRRFFRSHGMSPTTIRDAATCFVLGAGCGHPSGHRSGTALRERIARRELGR
jgi:GT2 family glycosyltransferase